MKEIELTPYKNQEVIESIYFGGGTPSLLNETDLALILNTVRSSFVISDNAEITLEANPDDISEDAATFWNKLGINRLSIGVQSFVEKDLVWMNRAHSALQAAESIQIIRDAGFDNFSIDLIFGVPGLSNDEWIGNIAKTIALEVPHISTYALTVEPETALQKMIRIGKKEEVDPVIQANQYLQLMDIMENAGYEHYEISSFALPGKRSRHNSSYWSGDKYFGFGPSAHSFDGKHRKWNIANNVSYINSLAKNEIPFESEELTARMKMNEYIMTSLRTSAGLDFHYFKLEWGEDEVRKLKQELQHYITKQQVWVTDSNAVLTKEGKLFADGIASALFRT